MSGELDIETIDTQTQGSSREPRRPDSPYRDPMASPAHRPPRSLRVFVAVLGVAALLFNVLLMMSDRAPGAMRRIGGDVVHRLFERIDAGDPAEVLADPRIPEGDAIVHFAVWAVAVVLFGWAVWTWIGLVIGALAVFAASMVVEVAQGRYSDTRSVEASDVRANVAGILAGVAFVAACYLAYSAVSALFGVNRRGRSPTA
jgi:hypothetical protein